MKFEHNNEQQLGSSEIFTVNGYTKMLFNDRTHLLRYFLADGLTFKLLATYFQCAIVKLLVGGRTDFIVALSNIPEECSSCNQT